MSGATPFIVFAAAVESMSPTVNGHSMRYWKADERKKRFKHKVSGYRSTRPLVNIGRTKSLAGFLCVTYHWRPRVMSMGFVTTPSPAGCLSLLSGNPVFLDERHTVSVQNGGYTAPGIDTRSSVGTKRPSSVWRTRLAPSRSIGQGGPHWQS
jgi:hypothetical protein